MMKKMKLKPAEFGEAISLGVSVILVLSLIGFLLYGLTRSQTSELAVSAVAGEAVKIGGSSLYALPIAIVNDSPRTITFLRLAVSLGNENERDIDIDYLASEATRHVYLYVDKPYGEDDVTLTPVYYKVD